MCKFCDAMEEYHKADAISKTIFPEDDNRYSVAIVRRLFTKGRRGCCSRSTDYRIRGCGYELNFCPECGRKIKKKEE